MPPTGNFSGTSAYALGAHEIAVPGPRGGERPVYKDDKRYYLAVKRLMDIILSGSALLLLAPFFAVICAAVRLDSKGAAIYVQQRSGKNGKPFKMYKFRSMSLNADDLLPGLESLNEADGPAFKIARDPRVTRVGRILRRFSADELPQLINTLRGEMSLVGPRPPLPREVEKYNERHLKRLEVTPGLTCLWQVSGRNHAAFENWVDLDLKYIRERSIRLDIEIMLKTIPVILSGKGA